MEIAILRVLWNLFNPMTSSYKIAKGAPLPKGDTIVRYIKPRYANADGTVDGTAFLSLPDHNGDVSYNWLNFFDGTTDERLCKIRKVINLKLEKKALFAELNINNALQEVQEFISTINIIYKPTEQSERLKQDYSHCIMTNVPDVPDKGSDISFLQETMIELLSACVGKNTHPAREPI